MKNIIIGITIGLLFNGLIAFAKETIIVNPLNSVMNTINTTKVTTSEGTYRIFIYHNCHQGGITAIKVK